MSHLNVCMLMFVSLCVCIGVFSGFLQVQPDNHVRVSCGKGNCFAQS